MVAVAVQCDDFNFVVWIEWMHVQAVEKLVTSKMMLPDSNKRVHSVHHHSGVVIFLLTLLDKSLLSKLYTCDL